MIDVPPLDYVLAGVVYLVADRRQGGDVRPETVGSLVQAFDSWFKCSAPAEAIAACLRQLAQEGVFVEQQSSTGLPLFEPLAEGSLRLTEWEFDRDKDTARRALATYRRSGPNWLGDIYKRPGFWEAVVADLRDVETLPREAGAERHNIVVTEIQRISISKSILELEQFIVQSSLSQNDKSQAHSVIKAAMSLSEAPTPPWKIIIDLLSALGSLAGVGAFAMEIVKAIIQGHL